MIDSHQHFWQYDKIRDAWITDHMSVIQRSFMPDDFKTVLEENGMEGCVAVQADQSETETGFLLSLAGANPFIKGVVGWVDLRSDLVEERLAYFYQFEKLKGWRHIAQAEPDGFLLQPDFLRGIHALKRFGYTYDILVYHNQLKDAISLVENCPYQPFVLDHCAKPAVKDNIISGWKEEIAILAQNPNVYCKLSGLLTEADWTQWNEKQIYQYLDVVFANFGTDRLMFGSDWPVMLLAGSYSQWKKLIQLYMQQFTEEEVQKVFSGNATAFYNL